MRRSDQQALGDHVASAFQMAHYFRLVGQPTPKAKQMVARVLRDQKPNGGWNIKEPAVSPISNRQTVRMFGRVRWCGRRAG